MLARAAILAIAAAACTGNRALLRKADGYMDDGRYAAAAHVYEDVLERTPSEPHALLGLAGAWIATGEPGRALAPAQVAVEAGVPGASRTLARALVETGRGSSAIRPAEDAAREAPGDPAAVLLLAETRLAARDLAGATEAAEQAMQLGGGPPALGLGAWVHWRSGNADRARSLATRAAGNALDDALVQADAASVLRYLGEKVEAEGAGRTARTILSARPHDWSGPANRRIKGGDLEGAARLLSNERAVFPDRGEAAWQLGQVWLAAGQPALAAPELAAALELAPFADGRRASGVVVANRAAEGMTEAERVQARGRILRALAQARLALGDLAASAAARDEAAQIVPSTPPEEWLAVAEAWEDAGQPARALAASLRVLDADQHNASAHRKAARILGGMGEVGRAIGHARMAWEADPGNADDALFLATLYRARQEDREARHVLEIARARNPSDVRLREAAGR